MQLFKKIIFFTICTLFFACNSEKKTVIRENIPVKKHTKLYGLIKEYHLLIKDTVKNGDSFGGLLDKHGVSRAKVYTIANKVKDSFDVSRIRAGNPYTVIKTNDSCSVGEVKAFVYEKSKTDYTVLHIKDTIYAKNITKKVIKKRKKLSLVLDGSLSLTLEKAGISPVLTHEMSRIYQWSIDFFKIQKGDRFKVIYYDKYLEDGTYIGIGNVEAVLFEHMGTPFYGFEYVTKQEDAIVHSYFDENAKSLQSFFLMAPLQFSRISSRYSRRRFHPVQKRWKAHKGTDYAAPHGTPIWSTANGRVIKAGYTRGNGNYVKIKHNNTYSTQYLHMSKILVKKGQQVKQGQIIGKVGSTGLATGPHVCYRFWVNGRQVDPYKQKLPSAKNIANTLKEDYLSFIKPLKKELDQMNYPSKNTITDEQLTSLN